MILELVAFVLVLGGDLTVLTARGPRRGLGGLDKGSTVILGVGLIGVGLLVGLVSLPSVLGIVVVTAALLEVMFLLGGFVLFVRGQPREAPMIEPDEVVDELVAAGVPEDEAEEVRRELEAISGVGPAGSGAGPVEPDGGTAVGCVLERNPRHPSVEVKTDSGRKFGLLLPKVLTWNYLVVSMADWILMGFKVRGEEWSPVTTGFIGFSSAFYGLGVSVAGVYHFVTGDNPYTTTSEVGMQLLYDVYCDEECEARADGRNGARSEVDGYLVAEIRPNKRELGNDITFEPEMVGVLGTGWSFTGSVTGAHTGVGVTYTSADLASGWKLLGTHRWKCNQVTEGEDGG